MPQMEGIKCVLLDIEGTICPISFVKDTLFPYALNALPEVLADKWNDENFKEYRDAFPEGTRETPEKLQAHVEDLTERDVKIAYLKNLQGFLWETGYKNGSYSTPLFQDVQPKLEDWKKDGLKLAIYSSGSVFAQKLLFEHVKNEAVPTTRKRKRSNEAEIDARDASAGPPLKRHAGIEEREPSGQHSNMLQDADEDAQILKDQPAEDSQPESQTDRDNAESEGEFTEDLRPLVVDWFDTTNAGLKTEAASYQKIADSLDYPPDDMLFLSDNVKELDAAAAAGMHSIMVDRPGNAPLSDADRDRLYVVNSLEQVELAPTKGSNDEIPSFKQSNRRQSQRLKAKEGPEK